MRQAGVCAPSDWRQVEMTLERRRRELLNWSNVKGERLPVSFQSTVYGPVKSWRFGRSLGIDPILRTSVCSFRCVYCQLGEIHEHTAEQQVFVPTETIASDLDSVDWEGVDVITISGNGEPTLALNLGEIIAEIRRRTDLPITVLTNATMLHEKSTRDRLRDATTVACKLDAGTAPGLQKVDRPAPGVTLDRIVEGIIALRGEFSGILAIQTMLMPMNLAELPAISQLIGRIDPDEVHLNTPRRPKPRHWYFESRGNHGGSAPVEQTRLATITLEEAREAEERLRADHPTVRVLSVYQEAPEE